MSFPVNSQLSIEIKDSHISHFTTKYGRNVEQVKSFRSDESLRVKHSASLSVFTTVTDTRSSKSTWNL